MIDLNADLGESFGVYTIGNDTSLMSHISSASIACGFHAGDPMVMRHTVNEALKKGVAVGAHPGYPDLQGFGRRSMTYTPDEIYALIIYQTGALNAFVKASGGQLQHIKPHGALYNEAARDMELALAIARAAADMSPDLILVGPAGSALQKAAVLSGIPFAGEVFADRAYEDDGSLVSRSKAGALIKDPVECIDRMLRMMNHEPVTSINGHPLHLTGNTICLHGDHAEAVVFATLLREALIKAGVTITALSEHNL
jgi:5-oxoprolinase (ATP-hydrolysing) subunit A